MKSPEQLTSELYFSDSTCHWFAECLQVKKPLDKKVFGVYKQRLDASDSKIRFAAKTYISIVEIVSELEHGEFIYFDDENRLDLHFYTESLIIFLRASMDLAISAYYSYFSQNTNIDSINKFLKKIKTGQDNKAEIEWLPSDSYKFWLGVYEDYSSEDYRWIHSLVGKNKGMSLRDLVIHKKNLVLDTYIDDAGKGRFYIGLTNDSIGPVKPWLKHIFQSVEYVMERVRDDIVNSEKNFV